MKKTSVFFILLISFAVLFFSGCYQILDDAASRASGKYGSLYIPSQSRSIDVALISSAKVTVTGSGIDYEISSICNNVENGIGSVYIERIPVGMNRIISVQAYDIYSQEIDGGVIRAVTDINPGENFIDIVNRNSSCKGNIYNALFEGGVDIGAFSESQTESIAAVTPTLDDIGDNLDRIDTESIVQDFKKSSLKVLEEYILPEDAYLKRLRISQSVLSSAEKPVFTAAAVYSDGTEKDVTDAAEWKSTSESVATVKNGTAELLETGSSEIYAEYTEGKITRCSPKASLSVSVEEAHTGYLYLDVGSGSTSVEYAKDNAVVVAWIWGNSLSSQWYELEDAGSGYMKVKIPAGASGIIFARGREFLSESSWNGLYPLWNKTADLTVPDGTDNTFVPSSWNGATNSDWRFIDHGDMPVVYIYASVIMQPSEDDTSLSSVTVNGTELAVSGRMVYTIPYETENAEIKAVPNYSGASVSIEPSSVLSVEKGGAVEFSLKVTAKDGNTENYSLKVKRSGEKPIDSDENKKRCYIEDTEEESITIIYDLVTWNDEVNNISSLTVRGSFSTEYNPSTKKWIEDTDTYSLSYDASYGWFSVTLPYEKMLRPGFSGQPEYKFYKNGLCLEAPSFIDEKYVFNDDNRNMMIIFEQDDAARLSELQENSIASATVKDLSDFDITSDDDAQAVSNFRKVPGTTCLYRSYHPFYPTHTSVSTERIRIEQVQALASKAGIMSDINLCDDRTSKIGTSYSVNNINYTVEIPEYYKSIIENNKVLYVGNSDNGNGYIPSAKLVYYNSNSDIFGQWIGEIAGFIADDNNSAPFQIHCEIGVDRTGVFCAVLAGLCGASWQQISDDYSASNKMYIKEFRDVRLLKYSLEKLLGTDDILSVADLNTALYSYFTDNGFVSTQILDAAVQKLKS